jgi:2-succinyl-6-hydroxy-2,4-cyclohexadiene-1-carboxylate synthase
VAAPVVIFVPGFMQRGETWAPVAELVGESYPSACLDFTTHDFEGRLGELREAARPGAVPVGYSMGGRLALHLAVREPRRFAGVIALGASLGIDDDSARHQRRVADEELAGWMERSQIEEVVARWERLPVFAGQSAALVAAQRAGRLSHDPKLLAGLLRSAGQGALPPAWEQLRQVEAPVLALAGERDRPYRSAAHRIAVRAPRGDARTVPGAGHAAHLERPAAVARLVVEFLDEHLGQDRLAD